VTDLARHQLGQWTWPETGRRSPRLLAIPVGSCEQHGPHLPLDTDTRVAVALAGRLAGARPGLAVGPAVTYGASGEHAGFPGTLSIGQEALEHLVVELVRSAVGGHSPFTGVVLVNGHGGNEEPLRRAAGRATGEGRPVLCWSPSRQGGDAHAGRAETSLLLAIEPAVVRLDRAAAGDQRPLSELLPVLRERGVRAVSANGVLGDPAGASPAEGHRLLHRLAGDLVRAVERWWAGR
jgi:mycofactocin precursor peptide peptidase